jgi:hypothetical protein
MTWFEFCVQNIYFKVFAFQKGKLFSRPMETGTRHWTEMPHGQKRIIQAQKSAVTTFNFMVNDGFYNSGSAQVTVNIGLPAAPQFTGMLWTQGNLEPEVSI